MAPEVFLEAMTGSQTVVSIEYPIIFLGEGAYWRTDIKTDDGAAWLSMTPAQGTGDADVRLRANPASLKAGTYSARVNLISPGATNSPQAFRVTFRVRDAIPATVRPGVNALTFTAQEGESANPAPQKVTIRMEGETKPDWTASVTSLNGGNWLSITPGGGKADSEITASVKIGDLPAGTYAARIDIRTPNASNPLVQIPVSFSITRQRAVLAANGIVNAASLIAGPIAPGQLITLAGDRMGPRTGVSAKPSETTNRFATSLGGTRVLFDGVPGVILYTSMNQINAMVPFEIAGKSSVKVSVESAGYDASVPVEMAVAEAAPGLFSVDGVRAAALNQDYSFNSPASPAAAGEVLQLFLTGQGLTTPRVDTGALAPAAAPFAAPDLGIRILLDGQSAEVLFAGLAPGSIGLLQVNVRIPSGITPSSSVLVGARIGNVGLQNALQIAVKAAPPAEPPQ